MSLILDALKKAQKENPNQMGKKNSSPNPIIPDKPNAPKRLLLLIVLLVLSIGFFITMRIFKKPSPAMSPQPIAPILQPEIPKDPIQLKAKALQLFEENKLAESLNLWEKLMMILPIEPEVHNNQGIILKKLGRKKEAYDAYQRALALQKDYPEAINNLGVLYLSDGFSQEAKNNFQKAIQLEQTYADPHFNLALVLEQQGNIKEASHEYQTYLDLKKELEEELKKKIQEKIRRLKP